MSLNKVNLVVDRKVNATISFITSFDIRQSKHEVLLAIGIIVYTTTLFCLTFLKHYCFRTLAFDMGIFIQIFWHSVNGNFLFTQPRGSSIHPTSFFGVHFSILLLLLIKIYEIVPSVNLLFFSQSLGLALPSIYIFKIAQKLGKDKTLSLIFAYGYLLYPGTLWSNWYDFHLESFIPLFLSMIYYYHLKGDDVKFSLSVILLLTVFERSVFIVTTFILYIFITERVLKDYPGKQRKTSPTLLFSILIFSGIYFLASEQIMDTLWPERTILEPAKIFGRLTYESILVKLSYLTLLAAPLSFLQINSPLELIPAGPYIFLALTTDYPPYFTISWQYPAIISVPFFISAIYGCRHEDPRKLKMKLAATIVASFILFSPGSILMSKFGSTWKIHIPDSDTHLKHKALQLIDEEATVLAQENIFPNLAERHTCYSLWPEEFEPPDIIVFDLNEFWFYHEPGEYTIKDAIINYAQKEEYGILANIEGFIILKKDYNEPPKIYHPYRCTLKFSELDKSFISFEDYFPETKFFVPYWVRAEKDHLLIEDHYKGSVWWGPYITAPPGRYLIEVHIEPERMTREPLLDIIAYQFKKTTYLNETVYGNQLKPRENNLVVFELELTEWVPSLEVIGRSYGNSNYKVNKICIRQMR